MHAQINGGSIHYTVEGEGPWLTMSHSLACNLHMWDAEAQRLARHYRVLRFDTRGHGESSASAGPYSLDMLADDVEALLEILGVEKTHFIGLSMGGMIGMTLAIRNKGLLRSLVLCDTSTRLELDVQARVQAIRSGGLEAMVEPTLKRFLTDSFREAHPKPTEKIATMIRSTSADGYVGCCHAIAKMALTEQLGKIRLPTLILVGEKDIVTPLDMAETIHRGIVASQLTIIPDAAHLANIEQPQIFGNAIEKFLEKTAF